MFRRDRLCRLLALCLSTIMLTGALCAQENSKSPLMSDRIPADRMKQYADLAVEWEQEYLQIDTHESSGK